MTESSIFWATTGAGDGSAGGYSAAQLFDLFRGLFTGGSANSGGVAPDYLNKLAVSGTATPVSVASGAAIVYGIPYFNSAAVTVAVPTPTTSTRIDRIVLRASWSAQTVRITRIAGTEGAGTPPAMTQSAGTTWDIPLANVSITTGGVIAVTDAREFLQNLGDGGVSTAKIADNAITNAKMADNAINTAEIVDAAVTLAKQANLAQARVIGRADGAGTGVPTALTPAQLITILTAADGTGSLLDADKLDGYQAAEFALLAGATFSGDVGIGVAPGASALAVNMAGGNVQFQGSAGNMTFDATGNVIALTRNGANYITANGGSSASFGLQTNGATRLSIDAVGTVELPTTTGALLIPRLTTAQRNALTAADGMVIYNTTDAALQVRQGGAWVSLSTPASWTGAVTTMASGVTSVTGPFAMSQVDTSTERIVRFWGEVYIPSGGSSNDRVLCTMSSECRPLLAYTPILCIQSLSGTQTVHPCFIDAAGQVTIQGYSAGAYYTMNATYYGTP